MAIFNSYVTNYQRVVWFNGISNLKVSSLGSKGFNIFNGGV